MPGSSRSPTSNLKSLSVNRGSTAPGGAVERKQYPKEESQIQEDSEN
jgi:hypothetical protein